MPEAFNTQTSSSLVSLYVSRLTLGNKYSRFLLSKMSTELSSPLGELLENVTENVRKEGECYGASDDVGVEVKLLAELFKASYFSCLSILVYTCSKEPR